MIPTFFLLPSGWEGRQKTLGSDIGGLILMGKVPPSTQWHGCMRGNLALKTYPDICSRPTPSLIAVVCYFRKLLLLCVPAPMPLSCLLNLYHCTSGIGGGIMNGRSCSIIDSYLTVSQLSFPLILETDF